MGKEVRRVPLDWQHPREPDYRGGHKAYHPLFDLTFKQAVRDWEGRRTADYGGSLLEQLKDGDSSPDPDYYRPEWPADAALGYAVYETVTEGTPVTPTFSTPEGLIDYLAAVGTEWDRGQCWRREAAESFVKAGWAPSLVVCREAGKPPVLFDGAKDADLIAQE